MRSIKNLAQKLQLKLIDPQTLSVNHGQQLGSLLNWINMRQQDASPNCIASCLSVFQAVSAVPVSDDSNCVELNLKFEFKF